MPLTLKGSYQLIVIICMYKYNTCMHSPYAFTQCIHRSKKDGDMSILPECIAGIKKEYVGKDDKKQSYWIEILTQV